VSDNDRTTDSATRWDAGWLAAFQCLAKGLLPHILLGQSLPHVLPDRFLPAAVVRVRPAYANEGRYFVLMELGRSGGCVCVGGGTRFGLLELGRSGGLG
jgi:hypothetical protein